MSKKNRILLSIVCSFIFVSSSFSLTKEVKQPTVQEEIKLHRHKLKCWQKLINFFYKFCYKNAYFPEGLFGKLILDNKSKKYSGEELLHFNIFPFLGIKNLGALRGSCKYMQEVVVDYWKNYLKNAPKNTAEGVLLSRLFYKAAKHGYIEIIKFFATNESMQNIICPSWFRHVLCEAAKNNHKKIAEYLILNRGKIEQPSVPNKDEFYGVDGAFEFAVTECYLLKDNGYLKAITFLACNKFTQNQLSSPVVNEAIYWAAVEENKELFKTLLTNKTTLSLLESGNRKSGVIGALIQSNIEFIKIFFAQERARKLIKKETLRNVLQYTCLMNKAEILAFILNNNFALTLIDKDVIENILISSRHTLEVMEILLSNDFSRKFITLEIIDDIINGYRFGPIPEVIVLLEKFKKEHFKGNSVEKKEVKNV